MQQTDGLIYEYTPYPIPNTQRPSRCIERRGKSGVTHVCIMKLGGIPSLGCPVRLVPLCSVVVVGIGPIIRRRTSSERVTPPKEEKKATRADGLPITNRRSLWRRLKHTHTRRSLLCVSFVRAAKSSSPRGATRIGCDAANQLDEEKGPKVGWWSVNWVARSRIGTLNTLETWGQLD